MNHNPNQQALKNKLILITWLPWSWKSFLAMFLSTFYAGIVSNLKVYNHWVQINTEIKTMEDIEFIENVWFKRCCILDEWWLNINARRWMSTDNLDFIRLWALSRKKNIDIIVISQLERMVDVAIRELCEVSFEMTSYFTHKDYLLFNIEVKNRHWYFIKSVMADLIKFTNNYYWTYDTEETSEIKSNRKVVDRTIELKDLQEKDRTLVINWELY